MTLGGFIPDDSPTPPATGSTARSTKEALEKLAHGDSLPIDVLSQFEAAVPVTPFGIDDVQWRRLKEDHRQLCEKLQVLEEALQSADRDLAHQKRMHGAVTGCLQARYEDLQT